MRAPADYYHDVVGWPRVRFVAHKGQWMRELDRTNWMTGGAQNYRYMRLEREGFRADVDVTTDGVLIERNEADMTFVATVPLWLADLLRIPEEMRQ